MLMPFFPLITIICGLVDSGHPTCIEPSIVYNPDLEYILSLTATGLLIFVFLAEILIELMEVNVILSADKVANFKSEYSL